MLVLVISHGREKDHFLEIDKEEGFALSFKIKKKNLNPKNLAQVLIQVKKETDKMPRSIDQILIIKKSSIVHVHSRKEIQEFDSHHVEVGN